MTLLLTWAVVGAVAGFALFLFNKFVPCDERVKSAITYIVLFVIIVLAILGLLDFFGIYHAAVLNKLK